MRSSRASKVSVALFALVLGLFGSAAADAPMSLDRLLRAFSEMPGLEARFVEEKTMSLLAVPLKSEGTLFFAPPGMLLRRVESPKPQELLVTGTRLRIREGEKVQELDLAGRPDVRPLVESLLWLFSGNRAALEEAFVLEFSGGATWTLSMKPRRAPLDKLVREIRLSGEGLAVRTVEVHETSGDRSVTRILDADPRRTFSAAEKERLFGRDGT
jgi:outer membrane lipoprotein-sorting protein